MIWEYYPGQIFSVLVIAAIFSTVATAPLVRRLTSGERRKGEDVEGAIGVETGFPALAEPASAGSD